MISSLLGVKGVLQAQTLGVVVFATVAWGENKDSLWVCTGRIHSSKFCGLEEELHVGTLFAIYGKEGSYILCSPFCGDLTK